MDYAVGGVRDNGEDSWARYEADTRMRQGMLDDAAKEAQRYSWWKRGAVRAWLTVVAYRYTWMVKRVGAFAFSFRTQEELEALTVRKLLEEHG